MQEIKDNLVTCPRCHSNMCYEQSIGDEKTWMCMGCGFTSTTLMKEGTETEKQVTDRQPSLYKDLRVVDTNEYVWYPAVIVLPEVGMVYVDGTNEQDWQWVSVPMRPLTSKEKRLKKYKGHSYVADTVNSKTFGQNGFLEAAASIGMVDLSGV